MNLAELMEEIFGEERGAVQKANPEDRVAIIKLAAEKLRNILTEKPTQAFLKKLAADSVDLIDKKVAENTIVVDLNKYVMLEKCLLLKTGQLAKKPNIDDLLTLVCLWPASEIDKLCEKIGTLFGKGYSEEEALDWVRKNTAGELESALKRYSE